METWIIRVYFDHTSTDVQINARTIADAQRLAESQYPGRRIGNISRVR